ncbi:MAG: DUF4914 family protein [Oscillibacter sp.]
MPPSTAKDPNYGVMGMLQVVPQSIAWLWRLISPRGFKNPSIADTNAGSGLKAEGVGSLLAVRHGPQGHAGESAARADHVCA